MLYILFFLLTGCFNSDYNSFNSTFKNPNFKIRKVYGLFSDQIQDKLNARLQDGKKTYDIGVYFVDKHRSKISLNKYEVEYNYNGGKIEIVIIFENLKIKKNLFIKVDQAFFASNDLIIDLICQEIIDFGSKIE